MEKNLKVSLKEQARQLLSEEGLEWADISESAKQIIVFGSFALSAQTPESDLDLLCIGAGKCFKTSKLHILWVPSSDLRKPSWRLSELATHIAKHGIWIKGNRDDHWEVVPHLTAIAKKEAKARARISAVSWGWATLNPYYRQKHCAKLRRELQRLALLRRGQPTLPRPVLDRMWQEHLSERNAWQKLACDVPDLVNAVRRFFPALRRI